MADDNDIDAGWDDIDAGWDAEASKPKAEAKLSANERITAESDPLPTMIPVPTSPEPKPEPPRELFKASAPKPRDDEAEGASFIEDDVTANRLYDEELLAEAKSDSAAAEDDAVVTIRPLTAADDDLLDEQLDEHQEVTRDRTAELIEGQAFVVPSPLKPSSGSGPAAVPPQQSTGAKPSAVNLSLVVFVLLLVLAVGAVGAVILAAFF